MASKGARLRALINARRLAECMDPLASFGEINDLMGLPELEALEQQFASK